MKPFESDKVKQLLEVLQKKPAQQIVHFTNSSHILTKYLYQFCQTYNNEYTLYCAKDVFYDKSMTKYAGKDHIHIVKFDLRSQNYSIQAIEVDYLIASLDFSKEDKGQFLDKCSPIIRTDGTIILIIPNAEYPERDEWRALLQDHSYISINIIDDLFEYYDVIIAKRIDG